MTAMTTGATRSRVRLLCFALIAAIGTLAVLLPAASEAKKKGTKAKVTVMTRNVYLGADLNPAIGASDLPSAIDAAGEIYNEVQLTDFPERAVPLAEEITKAKPDLVGLQEVAHWRIQQPSDLGWTESGGFGEPATETHYDFLQLLLDELGNQYKVVGVQEEFDAELPADIDGEDEPGTFAGEDLDYRLTMRDVILQRKGGKVRAKKKTVKMDHFDTLYTADVGGVPITADRGWISVEAKYKKGKGKKAGAAKKGKGKKGGKAVNFRFVNTHLEAFGDPEIREAQAKELYAKGGPLKTKKRVILVGDLNSGLKKPHNIGPGGGGSADPDDQLAFKALKKFGMRDYGAVQSCCYPDMFDETFNFTHTVDHVLANKKAKVKRHRAYVTGDDASEMTPSGLWPSDHGGVVSKLKLR